MRHQYPNWLSFHNLGNYIAELLIWIVWFCSLCIQMIAGQSLIVIKMYTLPFPLLFLSIATCLQVAVFKMGFLIYFPLFVHFITILLQVAVSKSIYCSASLCFSLLLQYFCRYQFLKKIYWSASLISFLCCCVYRGDWLQALQSFPLVSRLLLITCTARASNWEYIQMLGIIAFLYILVSLFFSTRCFLS